MGIRGMNRERLRLFNEALEVKHRAENLVKQLRPPTNWLLVAVMIVFTLLVLGFGVWLEETYPLRKLIEMPWERQE